MVIKLRNVYRQIVAELYNVQSQMNLYILQFSNHLTLYILTTLTRLLTEFVRQVSAIPLVPPLMQLLANSDLVSEFDLSSLRVLGCGAAPLSAELQNSVSTRLMVNDVRQGYGLTEATLASLMVINGRNKPGTSGCVVPGMECKVIWFWIN